MKNYFKICTFVDWIPNNNKTQYTVKKIKSALISVYYKDRLDEIVTKLAAEGVTMYSTGGTLEFIKGLGLDAIAVESLTGYP